MDDSYYINHLDQVIALYGAITEASIKKEIDYLHPLYQASPFYY